MLTDFNPKRIQENSADGSLSNTDQNIFSEEASTKTSPEAFSSWEKFLEIIGSNVSELKLNTWFRPIKAKSLQDNTLTIIVPSKDYYDMIISRFGDVVTKAIKAVLGDGGKLIYEIDSDKKSGIPGDSAKPKITEENLKTSGGSLPALRLRSEPENIYASASYFNSEYTFENFVKGKNNEFATAAAQSICIKPGAQYNPLMIYGGVGLGKTHLIQAIGNELRANRPEIKMMYISGPEFTTSFVQSIRTNKAHEFERYYKSLDMLILDDIQFLEGKESTQDSFFQIFNSLYQLKRQIVLSCDKPPHQLTGLEERLITRFQWGLTVDIQPPDLETRIAILNKKSELEKITVPYEVLEFIAINIKDNIRSLEGCLKSLIFDSELTRMPINLDMAKRSVVKFGAIRNRKQNLDIGSIIVEVSKFFDLEESLLRLKTKRQEIVTARHAAMFLCREMTPCSLETIGAHFGGRNHATVIHACKCVEEMINNDPKFREKIETIKEALLTS
jgi:chromosomal replication initiator protein